MADVICALLDAIAASYVRPRGVTMEEAKQYEEPKVTPVGNVNDLLAKVPAPEPAPERKIPDLVGTRWRRAWTRLSNGGAIAGGHMLPDTYGCWTRNLDGDAVFIHAPRVHAVLEVVSQEVVQTIDPAYPKLQALLVDHVTGWRRTFVFTLLFHDSYTGARCPALDIGHDRTDLYARRIGGDDDEMLPCCVACGDEATLDGLCRQTGWRQRDEQILTGVDLIVPPRPRLPVMEVVGGAGAAALVCGGLRSGRWS